MAGPSRPELVDAAGADRRTLLLRGIDVGGGLGLEIGPSINPVVPKASGARVRTVDHADAATLRAKYGAHVGVDTQPIEEVDHVWAGGRLRDAVTDEAAFDYVLASHVLEHLPNPLAFLQDCARLLRPGGRLSLALPDHRFCFDHARPLTTFGPWLDAYDSDRQLHTPGTVMDHLLYAVRRGPAISWDADNTDPVELVHSYPQAFDALVAARGQAEYLDVHAWVLNPSSFAFLVEAGRRFGLIDLELVDLVDTVGSEFFAVLVKPGRGVPAAPAPDDSARLDRLAAARNTERAPEHARPPATLARRVVRRLRAVVVRRRRRRTGR